MPRLVDFANPRGGRLWTPGTASEGGGGGFTDNPNEAHLALTPSMQDGEYLLNLQAIDGGSDDVTLTPSMQDGVYQEV